MAREFYIAGVQFHDSDKVIDRLKEGDKLTLRQEPTNKYDPNAVQIIYNNNQTEDDCFLGYVPAKFSGELSALMEVSIGFKCIVTEVNPKSKPWERIKVIIGDNLDTLEDQTDNYSGGDI